jgi:hypothetical protein
MADFGVRSVIRESLVGDRLGLEVKAVTPSIIRESLVGDRLGLDSKAITPSIIRETIAAERPSFGAARVVAEYLIKQPALVIPTIMREILTDGYTASVLIEQAAFAGNLATLALPVRPASEVQSITSNRQVSNKVVQSYVDNDFAWSLTRATQVYNVALTARVEALPISDVSAAQSVSVVSQRAELGAYALPGELWSRTSAAQVISLVVISTEIPYVPPSGAYAPHVTNIAVVASDPMPLPTSPVYAAQSVNAAIVANVEPLPISATTVSQSVSVVVTAADPSAPVSMTRSAAVRSQVVHEWQGPDPRVGAVIAGQTFTLAVGATVMDPLVGAVIAGQYISKAVLGADYPPVEGLVALYVPQVGSVAVTDSLYTPASAVQSASAYAFANTMFSQQAPAAFYPDPDDMYQAAAGWFSPQAVGLATQRRPLSWPLSQTPTAQVLQNVTQRTPYPSPEEMLQFGVTTRLAVEQVACVADYPSTVLPDSDATVTLAIEQVASVAEYPPAGTLYASISASLTVEQVASSAEYADKGAVLSHVAAPLVTELVASVAVFGDKDAVVSYATGSQVVQQVTSVAAYLSKDDPQSFAVAGLIVGQAASVAEYPAKANVGSALTATLSVAQVMSRDLSLYGFPAPPRRRRPLVIARFVWN